MVDSGYVAAERLVTSQQEHGIRLLGPTLADNRWQARADQGFAAAHVQIDWTHQQAPGPQGQVGYRWTPVKESERSEVLFPRVICADCPVRTQCTQSQTTGRVLHLRPQAAHEALQARRAEEQTAAFRQTYACRAGIEGTLAQGVQRSGLRHARYRGLQRTWGQQVLTAVALNVVRLDAWLGGERPQGTRRSHFERLAWRWAQPSLVA